MTITLGSMSTGSALHGSIKAGAWDYARSIQTFFGLQGEYHLIGQQHGRELTAWCIPSGYAGHEELHNAIEALNAYIGIYGTLVWDVGSDEKSFTNVVFNGFEPDEDPWLDGSGINGWQVRGTLRFRQVKS